MTNWSSLLAVALGGALGATLRWLLTVSASSWSFGSPALGTTLANVIGCLMIGLAAVAMTPSKWPPPMEILGEMPTSSAGGPPRDPALPDLALGAATEDPSSDTRKNDSVSSEADSGESGRTAAMPVWAALLIRVGLIGSLTTFSTFVFEAVELAWRGQTNSLVYYVSGNIGFGLLAVLAGLWLGHWLLPVAHSPAS